MPNQTIPYESPLSQSVTRDGKTARVDIYGNGEGGWLLEVVDEFGNSTVWGVVRWSIHGVSHVSAMRAPIDQGHDNLFDTTANGSLLASSLASAQAAPKSNWVQLYISKAK